MGTKIIFIEQLNQKVLAFPTAWNSLWSKNKAWDDMNIYNAIQISLRKLHIFIFVNLFAGCIFV